MSTETSALAASCSPWCLNVSTFCIEREKRSRCKIYSFFQCLGMGCGGVVWGLRTKEGKMQAVKLNYSPLSIKEEFSIPFSWPNYTTGLSLHPKGFIPAVAPYIPEMIIMPKYDGDLRNYLPKLSPEDRLDAIVQVSSGLATLHRLGLFHDDLSLSNIAYHTENKRFDIIDFGKTKRDASFMDRDVAELKNLLVCILMGSDNLLFENAKSMVTEKALRAEGFSSEICPFILSALDSLPDTATEIHTLFSAFNHTE